MSKEENEKIPAGRCIGIDLGTTNSCATYFDPITEKAVVIPNSTGDRTTPSAVLYEMKGGVMSKTVGKLALRKRALKPKNSLFAIKRLMGKLYTAEDTKKILGTHLDSNKPWQKQLEDFFPFDVVNKDGRMAVRLSSGIIKIPEEVSADILSYMKDCAEKYIGDKVTKAVITVPAYFNDAQRQATKDAAIIAGLHCLRLVSEPTAAGFAYGMEKKDLKQKILVFDLGGGTFDVSILDIENNVYEVLAVDGDTHLGGENVDDAICNRILKSNVEVGDQEMLLSDVLKTLSDSDRSTVMQRIKGMAEEAKIALSSSVDTDIAAGFLTSFKDKDGKDHPINLELNLTRAELIKLCSAEKIFERCWNSVNKVLESSKLKALDLNEILAVGGMTRMPYIGEMIEKKYSKKLNCTVNPDEVVAIGAGIQGAILTKEDAESIKGIVLLDVTPLSLGIETMGGVFTPIIERNTTIPTKKSQIFSTAEDNQTVVMIRIFQGERAIAEQNQNLGTFSLEGIAPAPRGVPQIEVSFSLDANGILDVTAKDAKTGKENKVTITHKNISKEEIERMLREAEENKDKDDALKARSSLRNESVQLIDTAEKNLKEHDAILTEELKTSTREAIDAMNAAISEEEFDIDNANTTLTNLREASMKIGQSVYTQNQDQNAGATQSSSETESGESA